MNQQRHTESEFERRLGAELTAIVTERGAERAARAAPTGRPAWRSSGVRLGLAAAAVGAVAAAVLIVDGGSGTPPAFAVTAQPEGMVSVEIRSPQDGQGLEQALAEAGIPTSVTYMAPGTACKEPRFRPALWPEGARTIVVGPPPGTASREPADATVVGGPEGAHAVIQEPAGGGGPVTFWISRAAVGPGQTLVITASVDAEGVFDVGTPTRVELAEGSVSPCEPIPAERESDGAGGG